MLPTIFFILLAVQIMMGAFDMLFHHELTERLAWRQSQRKELFLHGLRNGFYAVLFIAFGTLQLQGFFAWIALGILAAELVITLIDFVEEDQTRKLPWSERVLHTLLALNYGALLVFLVPVLWEYTALPTALVPVHYGWWTVFLLASACAVAPFCLRDIAASKRLACLPRQPIAPLVHPDMLKQSILVTGGTGFIGRRLVEALVAGGHRVTVLTRDAERAADLAMPLTIITSLDQISDDANVDTIINLAGEPIVGGFWTYRFRKKVLASRVNMTDALIELIARLETRPRALISGSAIGAYGAQLDDVTSEIDAPKDDGSFSWRLCNAWEAAAMKAEAYGVRTVCLRTGIVLDRDGGSLGQMLVPFDLCVGGPFGDGQHWMSWVSRDDLVRIIQHAVVDQRITGPLNGVAPQPIQNCAFSMAVGRALGRPVWARIPRIPLELFLGDLAREIFFSDQQIVSIKLSETGFEYLNPDLQSALEAQFGHRDAPNNPIETMPFPGLLVNK